jgi:hypothetical protein
MVKVKQVLHDQDDEGADGAGRDFDHGKKAKAQSNDPRRGIPKENPAALLMATGFRPLNVQRGD